MGLTFGLLFPFVPFSPLLSLELLSLFSSMTAEFDTVGLSRLCNGGEYGLGLVSVGVSEASSRERSSDASSFRRSPGLPVNLLSRDVVGVSEIQGKKLNTVGDYILKFNTHFSLLFIFYYIH